MLLLIAVIRSETLGLFWKPYSCWSHSLCNSSTAVARAQTMSPSGLELKLFELLEPFLAQIIAVSPEKKS